MNSPKARHSDAYSRRQSKNIRLFTCFSGLLIVAATLAFIATRSTQSAELDTPDAAISLISLATKDIIYDPFRNVIYASIPSNSSTSPNSVVSINPATGQIGPSITTGNEPGRLALSGNGQYLYVSFDGSSVIRRVDLQSGTPVSDFTLGMGAFGRPLIAEDIEVFPGQPQSIAIALQDTGFTHDGVAIFDNGTQRPNRLFQQPPNDVLEFAGNTLFGYNTTNTEFGLHRMAVDANGLTIASTLSNVLRGDADMKFDSGHLYGSNGVVIDPLTLNLTGSFHLPGFGYAVAPDVANNRVYFISAADSDTFVKLWAYDLQTFLPVGNVTLTGLTGRPNRLIKCGAGVFATRTSDNQFFLIQTSSIQPIPATPLPSPTTGQDSVVKLQLQTNDLIFDPGTQKVYASIPGNVTGIGNSIVPIDPATGSPGTPVFVGSSPTELAVSSNNQFLYAGLDGASGVRRVDLQSQSAGLQFPLGFTSNGPLYVKDIEVQPGNASVVAISLKNKNFSPNFEGVAVFDDGVKRNVTPSHTGSDQIEFAGSSVLYGLHTSSTLSQVEKLGVDSSGITLLKSIRGMIVGAFDFEFENGLMYATNGQVGDPETGTVIGSFPINGLVATDVAAGRVYYLDWASPTVTIFAFDSSTFLPVGFLVIPNVTGVPGSFIRWGSDGLAFRTTGSQVFFFHTSSLHPFPTATPTFTTRPDGIKELNLITNDIVYNPADQLIYASIPSVVGSFGNSIGTINPSSGLVGQPVFIGSEPFKIALSDSGNILYTTLGGAPLVRKYDIPTKTPGIQFGLGGDSLSGGQFYGENLAVAPGDPSKVAVQIYRLDVLGGGGVVLTNSGVPLPNMAGGNSLAFSGPHLFTYTNDTTEFGLRKLALTSNGFSQVDFSTNLINGFGQRIVAANGKIFASDGAVVQADSLSLVGKFFRTNPGVWVAPDPANNRVYFLGLHDFIGTHVVITAYDATTFIQIGSLTVPNVISSDSPVQTFIRYGADGLAFSTRAGKIFFLSTSMIQPLPPTPIPTPTEITPEIKRLSLSTGDLAYNRFDGKIYASVPSRVDGFGPTITFGNSIVPIDPATATLGQPVGVGSEPKKLVVTANGQTIYIGMDGEGTVARYDVTSKTVVNRFSLGNDGVLKGPRFVEDMEIAPGTDSTLAISRMHKNGSPRHLGVAIYDNGIQRPQTTASEFPSHFDNNNVIEYAGSASTIYGYNIESSIQNFSKLTVTSSGVQVTTKFNNPFNTSDFKFDNGLLYATNGQVINPETATVVGTYGSVSFDRRLVIPESPSNRVYFLVDDNSGNAVIRVYNQSTFALIGTLTVPGIKGNINSFIRWGTNGLAFRTTGNVTNQGNQLFIIQLPPSLTPPPPTPLPLQLLIDASGPAADQATALDSLLFVRDPFPVVNPLNPFDLPGDQNTRVIVFVRNLQLTQSEPASSVMVNLVDANNQTHDVPAEVVRAVPNSDFAQVTFRLPNNLAVGTCTVKVKFQALVSNTGTMRIRL